MTKARTSNLHARLRQYALRIIRLYCGLPKGDEVAAVIGRQLLRSGTSAGAHYCESIHSRSPAEFVSKIEGGTQELEESAYWLDLLADGGTLPQSRLAAIRKETQELISIMTASAKTVRSRHLSEP